MVACVFWLLAGLAAGLGLAGPDMDRMLRLAGERYGERGTRAISDWRRLIADAAHTDEHHKLASVNAFFNRRTLFQEDAVVWRQSDYWATPLEMLGRAAGDCEDFSIAKYMTLRALGVPDERLRLIYVRARIVAGGGARNQAHMVVGYYPTPLDEPLVLDNLVDEILPATRRPDLVPVFSFSTEGLWVGAGAASARDPTIGLSRWRSVLARMRQEGLR